MVSFEQLIQTLTDTKQPGVVRSSAIAGLVAQGSPQGIKFLVDALADPDSLIRREAAKALQDLNATSATEPLLRALQIESNDLTVWGMLEAIGELGTPNALTALESRLKVDSMLTRIEAKKSISRIRARYPGGTPTTAAAATEPETSAEAAIPEITEPEPDAEADEPIDGDEHLLQKFFKKPQAAAKKEEEIELTSDPAVEPDAQVLTGSNEVDDALELDEPTESVSHIEPTAAKETSDGPFDGLDEKTLTDSEGVDDLTDVKNDTRLIGEADVHVAEESDEIVSDSEFSTREDADIKELSESIARSPRLAGSSVSLPVLAPSASTVPYHPKGTALEPTTNFFVALLHPSKYLSKRWISRTRVYLILWAVLIAGVVGFTQYQKHFGSELNALSRIGLNVDALPEFVKSTLAEGDFYIQEGFYRKAINSYELSRGLGSLPIDFYGKLGFAYFKEGQYALAIETYELYLAAQENATAKAFTAEAALVGVSPLSSGRQKTTRNYEIYNILGTAYAKLGRVLAAEQSYERAIGLAPKYGEAYNNLARLYAENYEQPLTAGFSDSMTSRKLRLAEALAYTAVTLNPDVSAYHNTLGWILSKRGQVNKAMKTLERAIALQKDAVEPHYHLAHVALEVNDREKAAAAIRNVFKLKPSFVRLHTNQ